MSYVNDPNPKAQESQTMISNTALSRAERLKSDLVIAAADFGRLVEAVGGPDSASTISGARLKRIEAAVAGDMSAINIMHIAKLEEAAGKPLVSGPSVERLTKWQRETMPVPTLKEEQIAASEAVVAAALYQHAIVCQPEIPSHNDMTKVYAAQTEAQMAKARADNMRAVYDERGQK